MNDDTPKLHISPELDLPIDLVTETVAMLAKRGMGKSNAAVVLAEEFYDAGAQFVAIDPKGDWYGIRSSSDGTGPGLPIPVFGGRHGDLALTPTSGALMARLVIDQDVTCVLDLSLFSKGEQIRFATDFAETLFRLIGDHPRPLHLFLEEAEELLPQKVTANAARMVGAYSKIAKQGRAFGLGVTLVTQRSASLNKDALSQTDTLILFRTVSPHDRKAVEAWTEHNDLASDVAATLSSLEPGESWIVSPGYLNTVARVRWRRRRTFDSGATPRIGQKAITPKTLADVDLEELGRLMEATVEEAKAADPKAMRAEITALRKQLAERPEPEQIDPIVEFIDLPLLDEALVARVEQAIGVLREHGEQLVAAADVLVENIGVARAIVRAEPKVPPRAPASAPKPAPPRAPQPRAATASADADTALGKAERAVLTVLAQHPEGRTKTQIALLSGYSIKSSGLSNALGRLRSLGYATKGGAITQATAEGIEALGDVEPLPSGPALLEHWMGQLGKAEKLCLTAFIDAWPEPLDKQTIADVTGYSASSSGLSNALGRLRSLDLVEGWSASADLMASIT